MLHLPILRAGQPYKSLTVSKLTDFRTGNVLAEVSQANPGLIARELNLYDRYQEKLKERDIPELIACFRRAAPIFLNETVALGDDGQSMEDYLAQVSATTGMPTVMARNNMFKIATAMEKMDEVLGGLTRGQDPAQLHLSFRRETPALGAVLPNNSPGVHSLWLPAIALQIPLALKPGSREPWTPYRIAQALMRAGCPPEAFGYFPTDVNGTRELLTRCGKSMFFGDKTTVAGWKGEDRIQLHGPGWSKIILGRDLAPDGEAYLDLMVDSIAANGGRSCINVSGIWAQANGRALAEALARRLASIEAKPMDDPEARLSAFTSPKMAEMISKQIDARLHDSGAEDLTARYRDGGRLVEVDGCTFLLPTLIWCDDPDHPLARAEYLFPYCAVVETDDIAGTIEDTLVATVLSKDQSLIDQLLAHNRIDRINLGPIPTVRIRWDQPHEGNLFEFLYKQRAVQYATF